MLNFDRLDSSVAAIRLSVYTIIVFYDFRWIAWNIAKVESHGISIEEVEYAVNNAREPYPKAIGNEKWLVIGPTPGGTMIQVIYLVDADDVLFVIHARPLTAKERRQRRRKP